MAKKQLEKLTEAELQRELQGLQAEIAKVQAKQDEVRAVYDAKVRARKADSLVEGLSDEQLRQVVEVAAARLGGDK